MTEDEARRFLLVRAVETEDAAEAMLTREDRRAATSAGLSQAGSRRDDALLAARADFAFARLRTRFPAVARADQAAAWPRWLNWAVPLAAFILGVLTNEIDSGSRLNLVAFPLLGLIAWNLLVYLGLLANGLRRNRGPGPLARWLSRPATGGGHQVLGAALRRFSGDWLTHAGPLIQARARRTFHLARRCWPPGSSPACICARSASNIAPAGKALSSARPRCTVCSASSSVPLPP
jgi:hypothetical protein